MITIGERQKAEGRRVKSVLSEDPDPSGGQATKKNREPDLHQDDVVGKYVATAPLVRCAQCDGGG